MATAPPTLPLPPAEAPPAPPVSAVPQADAEDQELFRGDKIAVILFVAGFVTLVFLLLCDLFLGIVR